MAKTLVSPKTQYYTATSIDGFIADPDNSLEWLFAVEDVESTRFADFFGEIGAMAVGSTTYEWVLEQEKILDSPEKWQGWYGDRPTWLFTHRDLPLVPGADIRVVTDPARAHAEMTEAAAGKNIWLMGGGDLVGQFADLGLLDEIVLGVTPAFLGAGAPLLPRRIGSERVHLERVEQEGQFAYLTYSVGPLSS